jgi:hypothetical protein
VLGAQRDVEREGGHITSLRQACIRTARRRLSSLSAPCPQETEALMPEPIPVPPFLRRLPAAIVKRIRATASRPSGRER